MLRTRVERERLIVRLRGFALVFAFLQSLVEPGDSTALTWILVAVLGGDWLVTSRLFRRDPERNLAPVGAVGTVLDAVVCVLVLWNNRSDPADPIFLIVLFLALEAALRWGRFGGILGGLVAALGASLWGLVFVHGPFEHASLRFCAILLVSGLTGGLVHRLDEERGRLARLAYSDALTGLANRPALHEELAAALARTEPVALVYLDLDGFKAVNDRFGHTEGDAVLVTIAERMRATVREGDLVARLGGDEFVVVVRGEHTEGVDELAERLRAAVVAPIGDVRVGVSCGAVRAHPADGVDSLLRRADDAMYRAKRGAR